VGFVPFYVQPVLSTIILEFHQYLIAPTVLLDTFVKESGIHNQVGVCEEGYYCLLGSTTASPVQITHDIVSGHYFGGNICPTGHYCAVGSCS
jgi:hypothetical protein